MEPRRPAELLLALTLLALPLGAQAQSGRSIYCCEDALGRTACGDVLPAACYGRAYREVSPQGTIRRQVAAPLSTDEIARRQAEERQRKADEARALLQRRQDQALLETYATLEDLDAQRSRTLADVGNNMHELRQRLDALEARRRKAETEKDFYRERELPRELADELRVLDGEIAAQRSVIDAKNREMEAIRNRFDEDRQRYLELTRDGRSRR